MTDAGKLDFICPLFVPGDRSDRFAKAGQSGADAVIIDLEDAVAPGNKADARRNLKDDFAAVPIVVRINAASTPWHADDLAAVEGLSLAGVIVPKAECGDALENVCARAARRYPVIALIETARGVAGARDVAALAGIERLAFGSIDFCADLGAAHTREALLGARQELVLASRLAGIIPPIDGISTSLDDNALVSDDARYARDLGFGGKLCIHPRQIEPIMAGFRSTAEEIAWARKIVGSGDGAVAVDGQMVDAPVKRRAESILRRQ